MDILYYIVEDHNEHENHLHLNDLNLSTVIGGPNINIRVIIINI